MVGGWVDGWTSLCHLPVFFFCNERCPFDFPKLTAVFLLKLVWETPLQVATACFDMGLAHSNAIRVFWNHTPKNAGLIFGSFAVGSHFLCIVFGSASHEKLSHCLLWTLLVLLLLSSLKKIKCHIILAVVGAGPFIYQYCLPVCFCVHPPSPHLPFEAELP